MRLDPNAAAKGVRHEHRGDIDSTNAEALRLARAGERGPIWITASQQSAGRGRRGRAWISEPGNLYATLLLRDPGPPEQAAELSFVAALATHDAIAGRTPGLADRLRLKWPNDLLIDRNKCAGILVEGEGAAIAIGIGVNCAHHPRDTAYPATDLAAAGVRATPERLFEALSAAMLARLKQWDRGRDFAAVRADWLARVARLGEDIRVTTETGEHAGRFETVDSRGHLVLRHADGSAETIAAGDVGR